MCECKCAVWSEQILILLNVERKIYFVFKFELKHFPRLEQSVQHQLVKDI